MNETTIARDYELHKRVEILEKKLDSISNNLRYFNNNVIQFIDKDQFNVNKIIKVFESIVYDLNMI